MLQVDTRDHAIVSRAEWTAARRSLLVREKAATRLRDTLRAERLALPWVEVDRDYSFDTPAGPQSLAELFAGRSQLIVYHFMFGPEWQAGCPGCSFLVDHVDGALPHLNNHDFTFVVVSRAKLDRIDAYRRRMGWTFPWVSSFGSDFNHDFHVSFTPEELASGAVEYNFTSTPAGRANDELPGLSAFYRRDDGRIFHTYSAYARGGEELIGTLMILDFAPKGRNESSTMDFLRRHDEYDQPKAAPSCCA